MMKEFIRVRPVIIDSQNLHHENTFKNNSINIILLFEDYLAKHRVLNLVPATIQPRAYSLPKTTFFTDSNRL